jgi:hypothetical protein
MLKKTVLGLGVVVMSGVLFAACNNSQPASTITPTPSPTIPMENTGKLPGSPQVQMPPQPTQIETGMSNSDEVNDLKKDLGNLKLEEETFK